MILHHMGKNKHNNNKGRPKKRRCPREYRRVRDDSRSADSSTASDATAGNVPDIPLLEGYVGPTGARASDGEASGREMRDIFSLSEQWEDSDHGTGHSNRAPPSVAGLRGLC